MKKICCYLCALLALLLAGCAEGYQDLESARAAGVRLGEYITIGTTDVSGMTVDEALEALSAAHTTTLSGLTYEIRAGEERIVISGSQLPIASDAEDVVLQGLSLKPHWPRNNGDRTLDTTIFLNLETMRTALAPLTDSLNREATDATATYGDGAFSYAQAEEGRQLDLQALAESVAALAREGSGGAVEASFATIPVTYTEDMARADTALIAEFSTSFSGSTYSKANRVFNMQKAASLIDGVSLAPGEEFDMNATLGDRNEKTGWKMATAILDGTYVQEYGGGVCQVSTTLYNAVLLCDLEVSERNHHSWPLGYVDVGRDATISTGGPNFKFVNSTDTPITISASTDTKKKTIAVRIYGRHSQDWATIEIYSKKTSTLDDLGYEIVVDETLTPGETKEIRKSRRGCTAETYRKFYDADGNLLQTELVVKDKYRSIRGILNVSTSYGGTSSQ